MKKKLLNTGLFVTFLALVLYTAASMGRSGRYDFPKKNKQDIIKELAKRLEVIDSNLVFDGEVLTITLPGEKGEKGDTGQAGDPGKDGIPGKDGQSVVGPVGGVAAHVWEGVGLRFRMPDGTWGPAINLLGPRGRQGETGPAGRDGNHGIDGHDGKDGTTPVFGVDYFNGVNGTDGVNGRNGINGYAPQKSVDYFDGQDGKDGKDGKNGKDAILPISVTIQVLSDVKIAGNGKLVKTYKQIKVYIE